MVPLIENFKPFSIAFKMLNHMYIIGAFVFSPIIWALNISFRIVIVLMMNYGGYLLIF